MGHVFAKCALAKWALLFGLAIGFATASSSGLALAEEGRFAVVRVTGMVCMSCGERLESAIDHAFPGTAARVSFSEAMACIEAPNGFGEPERKSLGESLVARDLGLGTVELGPCPLPAPEEPAPPIQPGPWASRGEGLDVVIVSHGERVDYRKKLVPGKYTVVDFGAGWCGPCHQAADRLVAYMKEHSDIAVRAIDIAGADPEATFAAPVAEQHLQYAPGLPWLIVHNPRGGVLYRGMSIDKALAAVGRHRAKKRP